MRPKKGLCDSTTGKGYSKENPARIYCDGIFDLFHYGHAKVLQQAKKLRPFVYLLVGVCNDKITNEMKGKTVFNENERYESVRHCKWADEVIENAPWTIDEAFLKTHQIDFVAHDDILYRSIDTEDVYKFVKDSGRFLATQRTPSISTSDIITRIVKDYDAYLRRNLERGISPKDLNISKFKEGQIKVQRRVEELARRLVDRIKRGQSNIAKNWEGSTNDFIDAVESTPLIKDFLRVFNRKRPISPFGIFHVAEAKTPTRKSSLSEASTNEASSIIQPVPIKRQPLDIDAKLSEKSCSNPRKRRKSSY